MEIQGGTHVNTVKSIGGTVLKAMLSSKICLYTCFGGHVSCSWVGLELYIVKDGLISWPPCPPAPKRMDYKDTFLRSVLSSIYNFFSSSSMVDFHWYCSPVPVDFIVIFLVPPNPISSLPTDVNCMETSAAKSG